MRLEHVTYRGPAIDDCGILARLPPGLRALLEQINGFVQFHGGLHLRGACLDPAWHALRSALEGEQAFHLLYPDVSPDDIPFAEDALGDQFLLRDGEVWRLFAETGELESLDISFGDFLNEVEANAVEFLSLQPLLQFQQEGGVLEPGQLLSAMPPFCTEDSGDGVSLAAVPSLERRLLLASFASQIRDLADGESFKFEIRE
jgi:hypothetical protein